MYKLLIVEDEYLERELAIELIRKNYPETFEILESGNGKTALKTAAAKKPDLMLVDINIPGINGLELIRSVREMDFPCRIVITTVYDTFTYAQEAVKYGVDDYLLKPLKDSELCESMERCLSCLKEQEKRQQTENRLAQGIEKINSYAQKYVFQDILNGNIQADTLTAVYGWPVDGNLNAVLLRLCFCEQPADLASTQQLCIKIYSKYFMELHIWNGNELYLLLELRTDYEGADFQNILWAVSKTVLQKLLKNKQRCTMWVSEQCSSIRMLSVQIKSGLCNKKKLYNNSLPETESFHPKLSSKIYTAHERNIKIRKIVWRLKEGKTAQALGLLKPHFDNPDTKWEALCFLMLAILQCDNLTDLSPALNAMENLSTENALLQWLQKIFPGTDEAFNGKEAPGGKMIVREALRIMEEEYASDELTQTSLAERLGLNPAYFSRLFKKSVGKNFISMLTEIRIQHAREFLRQDINPRDCAKQCGYNNAKYFYEVFSAACGVSPFQYQRTMKEEKE